MRSNAQTQKDNLGGGNADDDSCSRLAQLHIVSSSLDESRKREQEKRVANKNLNLFFKNKSLKNLKI